MVGGDWIGWLAFPSLEDIEYYVRNKGKPSGQVPHHNFYFEALLVFLV